jgi:alpha-glucoside transport system substrate-binding protein
LLDDPPGCWLHLQASFAASVLPRDSVGTATDVFPFPSMTPDETTLIGSGEMVTALSDRPEVREMIRFLLSPDFGAGLVRTGEFLSPDRHFDPENYLPFQRRQAEALQAALEADTFRFDASDLMPRPIGDEVFLDAMMIYLQEGQDSLDEILAVLDDTWPDATG